MANMFSAHQYFGVTDCLLGFLSCVNSYCPTTATTHVKSCYAKQGVSGSNYDDYAIFYDFHPEATVNILVHV